MNARACLVALALAVAGSAQAASFRGVVTHVTDGDTVWVRPAGEHETVQIRLLDLDAPENCQLFGPQSKKALRERVLQQPVRVRPRGFDDYGRQLARIEHRREDIGAWLVRNGYAWSMTFHGRRGAYAPLEEEARGARRGLWALEGALDPRSFRKQFGRCR